MGQDHHQKANIPILMVESIDEDRRIRYNFVVRFVIGHIQLYPGLRTLRSPFSILEQKSEPLLPR